MQNKYEITFSNDTEINPVADDKRIKAMQLNFTKIAELTNIPVGSTTDVVAIVKEFSDLSSIMTKSNKEVRAEYISVHSFLLWV